MRQAESPRRGRNLARPAQGEEAELVTLARIGRAILEAQLDQDQFCELIYELAGQIVPTDNFQLGIFDGDRYQIKVWIQDRQRQPPATFLVPEWQGIMGWMRAARQPLIVRDFQDEMESLPARPSYSSDRPPRSAVFVPLPVAETLIGAISVQSYEPNAFHDGHLRQLTVLANQSASALNNARLYARGQRRLNDLTAVAEVGRKLTSILDLNRLLTQVVELIQSRFSYYHVQIFLRERPRSGASGGDRARFAASSGHQLNEKWLREGRRIEIGQHGIISWVAQHGEYLLANDVSTEPRYVPDDPRLLPDTRAELAVPLIIFDPREGEEREIVGVLDLQSATAGAFGQDDIFVLTTLADQVAVAVEAARAYEAQQEEAWMTTVMLRVAEAIGQAEGLDAVLDAAVSVVVKLAGVNSAAVWLWDEEFQALQFGASCGLLAKGSAASPAELSFRVGEWPELEQLRSGRTPVVVKTKNDGLPPVLTSVCAGDTVVLLPMLNKGQSFGVLGVSFPEELAPSLDERRLTMLGSIAHQMGAAVDNSRLASAREEEAWISTVLLRVSDVIRRVQPLDSTLAQVARLAPELTGVDRCALLLRDDDGAYRVRAAHAQPESLAEPYRDLEIWSGELPLLDEVCEVGQPLLVDDDCGTGRLGTTWRERFGSCTLLIVPLAVAGEIAGALLADNVDDTHVFTPRRVRILSGIANQTALAVENARLQLQETERVRLGRELELAQDIQRELLPQEAPDVPGYQIAYRWRSAREVGGDFFDFIQLPYSNVGLVVADVSDKGVPAALYMMFARTLMRAVALSGREPAAMLVRTNELIVTQSRSDMFVTAYYSVLDVRAATLTYASAGHNLALYAPSAGGEVRPMLTGGIPLGVLAPAEIEQKVLALAPGDVVLFYTDGLTDSLDQQGEAFGDERLGCVLSDHRGQTAVEIADAIDAAVREFVGGAPRYDDLTLIVLKRNPAS